MKTLIQASPCNPRLLTGPGASVRGAWHAAPAVPRGLWGWTSSSVAVVYMSVSSHTQSKQILGVFYHWIMFYLAASIVSNSRGSKFALLNISLTSLCWDSVAPRPAGGCQATPSGCLLRCLFYVLKMCSGPISSSFTPYEKSLSFDRTCLKLPMTW